MEKQHQKLQTGNVDSALQGPAWGREPGQARPK